MKRSVLVLGVLAAMLLAGCGETHGTGSAGTTSGEAKPVSESEQFAKEGEKEAEKAKATEAEGYHNMEKLAESYKETFNEKAENKEKGWVVEQVTCISTGKQSATCHWSGTEGSNGHSEGSAEITIAENGQTWISHS